MVEGGLLEEAGALVRRLGEPLPRLPIGYADAAACLRGEIDRAELVRRVAVAHRRYARRQVVWLRKERDVEWIRPPFDAGAVEAMWRSAP
jgi:tRNA dimethylallyltransferase